MVIGCPSVLSKIAAKKASCSRSHARLYRQPVRHRETVIVYPEVTAQRVLRLTA